MFHKRCKFCILCVWYDSFRFACEIEASYVCLMCIGDDGHGLLPRSAVNSSMGHAIYIRGESMQYTLCKKRKREITAVPLRGSARAPPD
jgi:hypothetical protein